MGNVVVVGQVGVDLVLVAPDLYGEHRDVACRTLTLGGKGANQSVGLVQAGVPVALVGVTGDDHEAELARAQARRDGIDCRAVVWRAEAQTALFVDVTDGRGHRVVHEHVPAATLLTEADLNPVVLADADVLVLQAQQPPDALQAAVRLAPRATVVVDGAPEESLLRKAHVLRADATETERLLGTRPSPPDEAFAAAAELSRRGPATVALEVEGYGDVVLGPEDRIPLPYGDDPVVDRTGGGDAFVAGLVAALWRGLPLRAAAEEAHAAAGRVVGHPGGRPQPEG